MKARTALAALAVPLLVLLGCARGEQAQQEETGMAAGTEETQAMPGGATATMTLAAMNNSGITGTAEIWHTADSVTVTLSLSGLTAGASYAAHVHRGTCTEQGPPAATLSAVTGGADGTGSSTTKIAMSQLAGEMAGGEMEGMEHPAAPFYVQVHQPDGAPAACATIEAGERSRPEM